MRNNVNDREFNKFIAAGEETAVRVVGHETSPIDSNKNNPSLTMSNDDEVVDSTKTLTETIGTTSYEATLSYNAAGEFLSMSAWSEV